MQWRVLGMHCLWYTMQTLYMIVVDERFTRLAMA